METILGLIIIVFGVLQIILFFKIWGMTNDVRIMTQQLEDILYVCKTINTNAKTNVSIDASCDSVEVPIETGFNIGDLVVDKNGIQWRVVEINAPIIKCKNSTKGIVEFNMKELRLF